MKPISDTGIEIWQGPIDHYIEKLPREINPDQFHATIGAHNWRARIQACSHLNDLLRVIALLAALREYAKKHEEAETGWDRFHQGLEKVEPAAKVAEFLTVQAKNVLKSGYFGELDAFEKKLLKKMEAHGFARLGAFEKQIVRSTRLLSAARAIGIAEKLLAGPIGLIIGGATLAIQLHEAAESEELGDLNAAMAHRIKGGRGGACCRHWRDRVSRDSREEVWYCHACGSGRVGASRSGRLDRHGRNSRRRAFFGLWREKRL